MAETISNYIDSVREGNKPLTDEQLKAKLHSEAIAKRVLARVGIRDEIRAVLYQAYEPDNHRTIVKIFYNQENKEGWVNLSDFGSRFEVILDRDAEGAENIVEGRL